jgi:anionic cell wall polymer biosynthesis LytR-Cps2A-Psr (LCP) family protein
MDAKHALAFVRERKSFVDGDNIRNKNQMIMFKAILKKCCSASIITKADGIFDSISESFETNMSSSEIKSLINMQIDDMASWDVQSYHLADGGSTRVTYLATVGDVTKVNKKGLFVMKSDSQSIEQAKQYIDVISKGETILKVKDE